MPDGTDHAAIGARLRWAREQAGLSQGQVARELGLHRPTVSQIEAGKRRLKADEVAAFAALYEVGEDWIVRGDVASGGRDPRAEIAARELGKLKREDLDTLLEVIRAMRDADAGGDGGEQ